MSDDNPYSESLFRTLKYTPAHPGKPFASIEDARIWVARFVDWYNHEHRHSGIGFVTPTQRHDGEDRAILAHRSRVYEQAKANKPLRWRTRPTRNWKPVEVVCLNPDKPAEKRPNPAAQAA